MIAIEKSDEWRLRQAQTIGGSSAAAVMGKSRFTSPRKLWERMYAAIEDGQPPKPLPESDDLRRGIILEPIARQLLGDKIGKAVMPHGQNSFVTNGNLPWAHVLPDGWTAEVPVEIKVPRPATVARCNLEGILPEWQLQCQHAMAVLDKPVIHLGVLDPLSAILHHYPIEADTRLQAELMEAEAAFYSSVKAGEPPEGDAADAVEQPTDGAFVIDDAELMDVARSWFRMRDLGNEVDIVQQELREKLRTAANGAACIKAPGVGHFRDTVTKPATRFDKARALADLQRLLGDQFDSNVYTSVGRPGRRFSGYPYNGG